MASSREGQQERQVERSSACDQDHCGTGRAGLAYEPENHCRRQRNKETSSGGYESQDSQRRGEIHIAGNVSAPHGPYLSIVYFVEQSAKIKKI
jgi:hypothetical protein